MSLPIRPAMSDKPTMSKRAAASIVVIIALVCFAVLQPALAAAGEPQGTWKAGLATVVITPEQSMWMAGYASRNKPSEGKVHDLHAKALALEDNAGTRLAIVTADLIGFPREFRDRMENEVGARYQLRPQGLLLCASHTHSGPELRAWRATQTWDLPPEQIELSKQYAENLQGKLVELVGSALADLAPARLSYTHARAGFAMNRRLQTERGYVISPNADGPVDHDVPVLQVLKPDGRIRALVFGYACHNTTLSFYQFCGDYAGFAQQYVEQTHPGTTAMFIAGCGGDQNPTPRRTLEWAQQHGRALANAVEAALVARPRRVQGPLGLALEEVALELEPPNVDELKKQASSSDKYARQHAQEALSELEKAGRLDKTYPYLVHVAQFDDDLTMIGLAGEVVVDYSLRLKAELAGAPLWVAGYCNDVFGYVPSQRVLQEGGYEARGAILYYGTMRTPFMPSVEKSIVDKVHDLVRKVRAGKSE
jgi:neutral ceramidase